MSNCSWGGYGKWVRRNDRKREQKDKRDATLRIDDDVSTPYHRCKQLLAWWITVCKMTPLAFARGFFLFILFHLKLVVTAPLYYLDHTPSHSREGE